jgi:TonB family protein
VNGRNLRRAIWLGAIAAGVCALVCAALVAQATQQPQQNPPPAQQTPATTPANQEAITIAADSIPAIDALAAKLATEIANRRFTDVAVFGALGPGEVRTPLGASIGDAVRESLARQAQGFKVVDRDTLRAAYKQQRLSEAMLDSNIFTFQTGSIVKADSIVMITLEDFKPSSLTVASYLFDALKKDSPSLASWKILLVPHQNEAEAIQKAVDLVPKKGADPKEVAATFRAYMPPARENGVGAPSCVFCPRPDYSDEARRLNIQGEIYIAVVITPEGDLTDINVLNGLGSGLDEKAVEAVLKWKLKPMRDSNGNAVAAPSVIEVQFQLFRSERPLCVSCPQPKYTSEARQNKIEGDVSLKAHITATGEVNEAKVVKSLGYGLDEEAIKAVTKWKFRPQIGPDGKAVSVETVVQVHFKLH